MFTYLPGIELPRMPKKLLQEFKISKWKTKQTNQIRSWLAIPIDGTTFSGHPTRTTLGNTLRSLCYMYYYLEEAGLEEPWINPSCFVIASGDDTV